MKIQTVNVIEYEDDNLIGITSYTDDEEGNKEAEEVFALCCKDQGVDDQDIPSYIEDGYYEQGTYQVFISHSA